MAFTGKMCQHASAPVLCQSSTQQHCSSLCQEPAAVKVNMFLAVGIFEFLHGRLC